MYLIHVPFGGDWRSRHYGLPLLTATLGAYGASTWFLPPSNTWQAKTAFGTALVACAIGAFLSKAHEEGALCEKCGELPEDVESKARRRRPLLAWEHVTRGTWRRHQVNEAVCWALVIVSALAPSWGPALATAAFAWIVVGLWATRVHNRLAPWCPWCRHGGGGDDEAAPTPDPRIPQEA